HTNHAHGARRIGHFLNATRKTPTAPGFLKQARTQSHHLLQMDKTGVLSLTRCIVRAARSWHLTNRGLGGSLMLRTSRLFKFGVFPIAFVAVLALACHSAQAQVKPFKITGGGNAPEGISLIPGVPAPHDAVGNA